MAQCRRRSTVLKSGRSCSPGRIRAEFRDAAEAPPGQVNGTVHAADGDALQAKNDLTAAYDDAAARPTTATVPVELGGRAPSKSAREVASRSVRRLRARLTMDSSHVK